MVEALRRGRRKGTNKLAAAAVSYAAMGWPVCPGAHPRTNPTRHRRGMPSSPGLSGDAGRACSCDRIGCPAPGAHPVSPAWQIEASSDPAEVARWWGERPESNVILVTGRVFDALDVPAAAAWRALERMAGAGVQPGPVALTAGGRAVFLVVTRGAPDDEGEWWSCHLDCEPDSFPPVTELRWHCRNSYVLGPPSRYGRGHTARWIREPGEHSLPDGLRLLEFLADACDEVMR